MISGCAGPGVHFYAPYFKHWFSPILERLGRYSSITAEWGAAFQTQRPHRCFSEGEVLLVAVKHRQV